MSVKAVGGAFVPLQAPLKPGSELKVVPGASEPLWERFVMVTTLPLCVKAPFHPCVTVWPLGKVNVKDQPLTVVVPVLVIVKATPNPPGHWLEMA